MKHQVFAILMNENLNGTGPALSDRHRFYQPTRRRKTQSKMAG